MTTLTIHSGYPVRVESRLTTKGLDLSVHIDAPRSVLLPKRAHGDVGDVALRPEGEGPIGSEVEADE
ncbi:hypothetical protein [Pseudoxanthomonas winnipegensis]|uniref:Uncharacterized protein n=1 Tax=Pseudoxanthomonas winnipegensis TaxID=2480810 RepID=A0A4Q8LXF1_9GAMM|nr:hypothetical protein [Pseudoxanthomonas winnipegensis]RZZ90627.1 hypothetical protein EA663_02410 [Pseudoxanthomonas winnipegensis]TAA37218.1 hypothetical protein EA656_00630 [Pseudoxanthomonas winnipegensis]